MEKQVGTITPRYRQIAADIAAKIVDRQYLVGDKVYARSLIASQYSVSAETARRAIAVLTDMDIVSSVKGSGVVIKSYENAFNFVKLNQDATTIEDLRRDVIEQANLLQSESMMLKEKIGRLVDRTTQLKRVNPFVPYEITVDSASPCLGKSLSELKFWQNTSATVIAIRRGDALILSPGPYELLCAGDFVYFIGNENCYAYVSAFLAPSE